MEDKTDKTLDGDSCSASSFKAQEVFAQGLYPVQCIYGGVPKRDQREVHVVLVARRFAKQ